MKNNMMRNLKKRALALVLCFAMVLNTGVTTFAEENQGTVPEVENTEYKCGFEAHEHEDTCYSKELLCEENAEPVLTCVIETHEHEAACYEEPVLKCEKTEHKHGDACYTAHVHGDGCYIVTCTESTEPVLACTTEAYAHTDSCYTAHVHGEGCYENKLTCETPESTLTCTVADCIHEDAGCYTTHSHGEGCHTSVVTCEESTEPVLACEKAEHKHGDACYTTHEHGNGCYTVTCTESTESVLVCTTEEYAHTEACYETPVLKCEKTEHVHDEEVCYVVEHVHEDKCYTEPVLICEKAVHTHTEECKKAEPVLMKSRSPKANEDFEAKIGDNKFETLKEAVDIANASGGAATVLLLKDISLGEKLTISGNVTIDGGGEFTIYRKDEDGTNDDYNGTLFEVNENASLTLAGITIDEKNEWIFQKDEYEDALKNFQKVSDNTAFTTGEENSPIANSYTIINNGSLNIDNTKIQNHFSRSGGLVNAGKMSVTTLKDATIIHNTYNGSGLVVRAANYDSNAVINVTGNTYIADNYVGGNHGLFMVYNGSTINMDNGLIENNTGINANGIVVGIYGSGKNADGTIHYSTMNMSGGTIRKNSNIAGNDNGWNCTIYVYAYGPVFHMTGGVIENNTGKAYPGVLNNGGGASDLILEGGSIISNNSLAGRSGADLFSKIPLEVRRDTAVTTSRLYNNVTSVATLTGDVFFYGGEVEMLSFSGANGQTGKILGDVTVMNGANMLFEEGTWEGLVTVDAVGNDTSLTVEPGAKIAGGPVRVLASVTNADSANVKEADTAQSEAYDQKSGAMVDVPVLYYHRLTSAQKNTVVITYDYNGGLDAQNWSGIQRTGTEPYTLEELPVPTREGHVLTGWNYATDTKPESLDMSGDTPYVAGTVANESKRLVAQWKAIDYVCFIDADEDGVWDETEIRYETLAEAVDVANKSENAVSIVMIKDINYDDDYKAYYKVEDKKINALNIGSKGSIRNITISGEHKIFRGSYPGTMLKVNEGSTLTLDGKLTLDGNNNWTFGEAEKQLYNERLMGGIKAVDAWYDYAKSAPNGTKATGFMITTESGTVNLNKVTIQNNYGDNAGIVKTLKAGSKVNLTGATIQHVATPRGNGLAVFSEQVNEINVNDGTLITGNHVGSNHGIFKVYSGTVIKMTGGTISHNTGYDSNGVVIGMWGSGSSFYMTGGTISHNSSTRGSSNGYNAAVYLHYNSYMKMTGGEISNNIGYLRGGIDNKWCELASLDINRVDQTFVDGVYADENGKDAYVKEYHPIVIDNISVGGDPQFDVGRGPDLNKWWITGGIYTQDVDEFCAKGYVCIPYEDSERTDDYIVVPGYRVRYHAVDKIVTREPATGEETTTYNTTLVHKEFHIVPRDELWYEMDEKAQYVSYTDEETGKTIDTWYREKELQNEYKFNETKLIDNLDVYGKYNPRYGYVVIEKNLENYNKTMKGSTFVYEVTAEKYGDPTYKFNEVVAIEMDGTSGKYVKVGPILEEAEVTVTEIYSGAGYTKAEQPQKKTVVFNEAWNEWYKNPNPAAGKTILNGISLDDSTEKENETYVKVVFTGGYIPGRINYGTSAIFRKENEN